MKTKFTKSQAQPVCFVRRGCSCIYRKTKSALFFNGIQFISTQGLGKPWSGKRLQAFWSSVFWNSLAIVIFFVFLQIPLIRYWFCIVLVAIGFTAWQSRKPTSSASSTITRKFFHLLALAVYIPGIIYEPYLMHLASSVAVAAFIFVEVGFNLLLTPINDNLMSQFAWSYIFLLS